MRPALRPHLVHNLLAPLRHCRHFTARPILRTYRTIRNMTTDGSSVDAASAAATATVCVHAATPAELQAARHTLEQAGPLVSRRATADQEEAHCRLAFAGNADVSTTSSNPGASPRPCGTFSVPHYLSALDSRVLGRVLLTASAITSTQVVVQQNVSGLPDGLLFVADKQYGGKGRGGNKWESPDGCLMFSVLKRLEIPGQRLPFVQYIVSLAVVQAVQAEAAARLQGGSVDVRIKWPNDVYAGRHKLGGILCHSSYRDKRFHIIMGVGLNLSNRTPTTCVDALIEQAAAAAAGAGGQQAAQQAQQQGQEQQQEPAQEQQQQQQHLRQPAVEPVSREALLAGVMSRLEPMLDRLAADGFAPFEAEYCRHWLHSDQQVHLEEGGQLTPVTIRGLSPNGYLLATDAMGERYELHPDGNSLDFFQGLVRKKLPA